MKERIPHNHPAHKSGQKDFWRREYIRLLTEPEEHWTELTPERVEELNRLDELIQAGYLRGEVLRGEDGSPCGSATEGPTPAGRLFAEEQQEYLDKRSLWGRVKSGAVLFIGWLAGILSALVVWRLTK